MNPFAGHGVNFEVEAATNGTKKRSLTETGMNEYGNYSGIDLELKLSLPGSKSGNVPNALKSPASVTPLPPSSSRGAYLPPILGKEENHDHTSGDELSSLTVMGCTRCLFYVMVSNVNPKCPNCKNPMLINIFQVNPAKKLRTSLI
ncbi:uncharacterized protein LOC109795760 [Cajanus cajan]|uniref:uncharacterized protein LOC109795760 n=1 Tax=Cajanus cajan TaxID=3821 RepID=UPI00098D7B3B|nr:uncharacterized protein LOC109795760 [Cajanus cajan]